MHAAHNIHVRSFSSVRSEVFAEVAQCGEVLGAAILVTVKRLSCVQALMGF